MNKFKLLCNLLLLLGFVAQAALAEQGKTIMTQGGTNPSALACMTCHGEDGKGMPEAGFPRLAGLSANYMKKQLKDFQQGSRIYPVMQPIANALSNDEIETISTYLSRLPTITLLPSPTKENLADQGYILATRGDWSRNIPPCISCHGPDGIGVGDLFPPLAGQSPLYLTNQLNAWKDHSRKNDPNKLMVHIAQSLSDEEIKAVSDYFSTRAQ